MNYWLMKKRKRFAWRTFFTDFRINQRMTADFFHVERRTIGAWQKRRSIPVEHLERLKEMNQEEAEKLRDWKWAPYKLAVLQKRLHCTQSELAKKLGTSGPNVRNWKDRMQIPRTLLPKIKLLEHEAAL